jgi:hypothetical protein
MIATNVLRAPFLLLAILCETMAATFRWMAWLIRFPWVNQDIPEFSPLGYWRCTHSDENFQRSFLPGGVYRAMHLPPGSIRIIPSEYNSWAPYWERAKNRFCYEPHELDFEYIGNKLPAGEKCRSYSKRG